MINEFFTATGTKKIYIGKAALTICLKNKIAFGIAAMNKSCIGGRNCFDLSSF
jgi:hypothetical protein